ncbi:Dynein regulatory complex subunit 3 [Galemys pyrenaicus]|uniref:Dynein regulatory complex subunit 3 n=1 Tax=Galemys pyrenaicus TaxID=202257 RepID=A0A8J6DXJ5_GALPY|nr:Dynein regulatory complex subunit 3 [Galemys pyrenaicus]
MNQPCHSLELRVMDEDMLKQAVVEQGPQEEAGQLAKQEGILFKDVLSLRLDFQNILHIDNLWQFENLRKLQLDNNFIERIEGLEKLIHLVWLDLSFNNIEVIEGLDTLVNLEDLSLFNNRITKIDSLDALVKLQMLSLGNNDIGNMMNIIYLRRFKNLRTLRLSGNPIAEEEEYKLFICAYLPDLVYLDFRRIDEHTASVSLRFPGSKELAEIKHQYSIDELKHRENLIQARQEDEWARQDLLAEHKAAFVEYMNGSFLFDSMYTEDVEGNKLAYLPGVSELLEAYPSTPIATSSGRAWAHAPSLSGANLLLWASPLPGPFSTPRKHFQDPFLAQSSSRFSSCGPWLLPHIGPISEFSGGVAPTTPLHSQPRSLCGLPPPLSCSFPADKFIIICMDIFEYGLTQHVKRKMEISTFNECMYEAIQENQEQGKQMIAKFEEKHLLSLSAIRNESDLTSIETKITESYETINELFDVLMTLEMQLVEQLEETINMFERNIIDLVGTFIENCRDLENHHHERLLEISINTLEKILKGDLDQDLPDDLRALFVDKDTIVNAVGASHDIHLLKIDNREDELVTRVNSWCSQLVDKIHKDEIMRNRKRVKEINQYIDHAQNELDNLECGDIID